jgi:hypothetical protein
MPSLVNYELRMLKLHLSNSYTHNYVKRIQQYYWINSTSALDNPDEDDGLYLDYELIL